MVSSSAGVDAGGGLVEQDQARLGHQHAGELQQLALAAGEHARRSPRQPAERDELDQRLRPLDVDALLLSDPARGEPVRPEPLAGLALHPEQHVLQHAHGGEGPRDLEGANEAECDPLIGAQMVQAPSVQADRATGRGEAACQKVEHGRLAGAVRPDEPGDAIEINGERNVIDGAHPAEAPRDAVCLEHIRAFFPARRDLVMKLSSFSYRRRAAPVKRLASGGGVRGATNSTASPVVR